ncbi:MAG: ferredoxin [Desulfosudaceae bacterium]
MKYPVIELSDCIRCEICCDLCPEVFTVNDAGYVAVADLPAYPEAAVNEAVKNCPVRCIYWEEQGKPVAP